MIFVLICRQNASDGTEKPVDFTCLHVLRRKPAITPAALF